MFLCENNYRGMANYYGFGNHKWSVYICITTILSLLGTIQSANFSDNFYITWGNENVRISDDNQTVQLILTNNSGAGIGSKHNYLFGSINMNISLVAGYSAGIVTTFYISSDSSLPFHDEVDFEFLGNVTGKDYGLQTNVFTNGIGKREQRINLWFDPTTDFHNYSIVWNRYQIMMFVDSILIRVFKNNVAAGVPYANSKPMGILASIWNGEDWATDGGRVKIDWSKAPFNASYKGFNVDGCIADNSTANLPCTNPDSGNAWDRPEYANVSYHQLNQLEWVRKHYMYYDYCTETQPQPPECELNNYGM